MNFRSTWRHVNVPVEIFRTSSGHVCMLPLRSLKLERYSWTLWNIVIRKPALQSVYAGTVHPVPTNALPFEGLLPPITRPQAGRPKKVHLRNRSELQSEDSPIICSLCNEPGQHRRTCERRRRGERVERH
jgi:hypothetical protein